MNTADMALADTSVTATTALNNYPCRLVPLLQAAASWLCPCISASELGRAVRLLHEVSTAGCLETMVSCLASGVLDWVKTHMQLRMHFRWVLQGSSAGCECSTSICMQWS